MSFLPAILLFSGVLLALDLWTAPKHSEPPRANLKDSRHAA